MAISTGQGVESRITLKVQSNEVEAAIERLAKLKSTLQSVEQSNAKTQKIIEQAMVYHNRSQEIANRTAQNTITSENNRVIKKQESEAKIQRLAEESATRQVAIEEQSNAKILALQQRLADEKIRLDAKNVAQIEKLNAQTEKYNVGIEKTRLQMEKYKNSVEKATKKTNLFKKAIDFSKIMANIHLIKRLSSAMMTLFQSSADFYENLNLFNIVMRDSNKEGTKFVNTLQSIFGLDESPIYRYIASFKGMANNMGIVEEKAYTMAESLTKMTLDLSAMYNTTINDSFEALMSAVTGQVKSIRDKFAGIDITEKSLEVQLKYMGINDRSIGQMNYAEKSIVRYLSIQRQAANAQGVFASEMLKPAQMLKLLGDRVARLGRAIGNIFIPVLSKVLPYLMAIVEVMTVLAQMLADTIALLFGFDFSVFEESNNVSNIGSGIQENFDNATASAKKFKRQLQGFDVLNVITTPTDTNKNNGSNNGLDIDPRLLEAIGEWDMRLGLASEKINKIRDGMLEWLGITKEVDETTGKITYSLEKGITPIKTIGGILGGLVIGKLVKDIILFATKIPGIINGIKVVIGMLSGSSAALSASTFMGGKIAIIGKIITGIKGALAALTGPIGLIVAGIVAVVGILIHAYKTSEEFRNSINTMAKNFVDMLKAIYDAVQPVIEFIWNILKPAIDWVVGSVKIALQNIYDIVVFVFDALFTYIGGWFKIIEKLLHGDFTGAWQTWKDMMGSIKDKLIELLNKIWERFKGFVSDTWNKIVEFGKNLLTWLSELPGKILYWVGYAVGKVWKFITETDWKQLGKNILNWILNGLKDIGSSIKDWATSLWKKTKSAVTNIDWGSVGSSMLDGLLNGAKKFGNKLKEWGKSLLSGIKDALGIHSPSILAEKEVGINVGLGTIKGMEKTIQEVDSYTDSLLKTLNENLTIETPTISYSSIGLPNINDINAQISTNGLSINESINTNNLNHKIDLLSSAMSSMQDAILKDKNSEYVFPIYVGGEKVDQVVEKRQQRIENMYGISR